MAIDIEENGEAEDVVGDFLYAARAGDEEWLLELLATRPELVSEVDENGNTALHLSSANGHAGIIRTLLKYPQSISPRNNAGNTPLHWACLNNHAETAKLLVTEGADMFLKNNVGRDAVWEAEQRGNEELVSWLLSYGEEKPVGEISEGQDPDDEITIQTEAEEKPREDGHDTKDISGDLKQSNG